MMITTWWLALLCPVCAAIGFFWAVLLAANNKD